VAEVVQGPRDRRGSSPSRADRFCFAGLVLDIGALRRKVGPDPRSPRLIVTVPGGYRFT
jgi:hypothetical protein